MRSFDLASFLRTVFYSAVVPVILAFIGYLADPEWVASVMPDLSGYWQGIITMVAAILLGALARAKDADTFR